MRSAETSDVSAKGAFAPNARSDNKARISVLTDRPMRLLAEVSPVTLAVTGTAFAATSLFIVYDVLRTTAEARALAAVLPNADDGSLGFGIWQRALIAVAVALLAAVLAFRKRASGLSDLGTRRAIEDIMASVPFGVAVWTALGELVVCNAAYGERLSGVSKSAVRRSTYPDAVKALTSGGYLRMISDGEANRTLELHRDDGSCLLIDERPLRGGGFVTLISDITDRKRTDVLLTSIQEQQRQLARRYHEEKLKAEAASRAKTSFLAHLSHDIRTPLNHIIGFAELIRQQTFGPVGDPRYLAYLDTIKGSGEKLLGSFATILELAELENGSKPLREEAISVDEMLATVMRRFATQASRAGVVLSVGTSCGAGILADRFFLERMLGNLIENALRFTPAGGKVTLAAYSADDGVVLEVTDTGIGMTEEQLGRLSQPFAFGDAAFTREHDGAGLGVAISRAIAELSGGGLVIDSRPTLGTTVAISLPTGTQMNTARAA